MTDNNILMPLVPYDVKNFYRILRTAVFNDDVDELGENIDFVF